ncbi:glucosaminidase domain-containing protein [Plebeiibacterium marinum]|uniref:Peptidoglycan hydrolase n=1 Tax=Plebeiibacterium marinum TaxID=2992111 RepID=A0AAE3MGH6_9BACT|nr:glucosaminidase domain-containing protein [Plebeiobacterium marinum]MCW3807558.1 glucosaminidase domain-containing protein [Plebeiobacterium marinum]
MIGSLRFASVLLVFQIAFGVYAQNNTRKDYIGMYSDLAVREMKRVGIPASITLAQGMLESGNGNSTLARKSNNHFGIKCHNDWTGKKVYHDDDKRGECFRKYQNVYESYLDHSDFLVGKKRYASLFDLKITDYKGWAHGLKKAGYATDPKYARRLIDIIEENNLDRFDRGDVIIAKSDKEDRKKATKKVDNFMVDAFASHNLGVNNGIKYITVQENDSFAEISSEFGLKEWEIYAYNDLQSEASIKQYKYLYVQPKRNKAHRKHRVHRVKGDQSLHYIAQKYGVKISRLYKYNNLKEGDKVKEGQLIYLRKKNKRS